MTRVLVLLLLSMAVLVGAEGATVAESPPPVEPLAEAPWYDPQGDTWRRVVPKPPAPETESEADDGGSGDGTPLFAYAMYLLVAVAIGLLAAQLWRLRGGWGELDAEPRAPAPAATIAALPFALPQSDQDPESALRAALAAGDLALAVVWLYALQLLRLDTAGVIRLTAGKTNRGYLREAGSAVPATVPPLQATVAVFERSFFGHQAPSRAEVEALIDGHRTLIAALPVPEVER